jgi:folate-binding protein YgfZ
MTSHVPLGPRDVIAFSGPDAVRFLNGQITQDVRKVVDSQAAVHACVTDAKGRLQFRICLTADEAGRILVAVGHGLGEDLEARLTRYLIADDAEASPPAIWQIHHFLGEAPSPTGVLSRTIDRFGEPGTDWWLPPNVNFIPPPETTTLSPDAIETLRIRRAVPEWGSEITPGMLPPEALLESTDISYQKGCYIGQEVISRVKSAGKVNRLLTRFEILGPATALGPLTDSAGREAGAITSIAPADPDSSVRLALGFLKRTADPADLLLGNDQVRPV